MRLHMVRLGLVLVVGLIALAIVGPAMADDGPVRVQVDKAEGERRGGLDAGETPPPVTTAPSAKDVGQTDGTGATDGPNNDWELWLVIGLAITTTAAGSISFRAKGNWDLAPQVACAPPAITPPPTATHTTESTIPPLSIRNGHIQEYDPAEDFREVQKSGRLAESDPGLVNLNDLPLIPASTVGSPSPDHPNSYQVDRNDPSKGSIVVYSDNTWEVLDEDGKPLVVNDIWQSTSSVAETAGKYIFRGALGAVLTGAVMLPTGGAPALFGGTVVGIATGASAEAVLPVPKVGQNDVVLIRVVSCKDEPQYYSPILEGYVTRRVLRFSTFHFAVYKDGHVAVVQGWTERESVLNPSQDCSRWTGSGG